jgi:RNA polymerase sigma-70 factor, ECF subfamily
MQNVYMLAEFSHAHSSAPVQPRSDEALVAAIAKGDKSAMQVLFARHSTRIYRFIARRTGNACLAEDVVSEVFLDVWRRANRFEGRSKVATWLLAIARHKALNVMRRTSELPLDDAMALSIVDTADDPEAVMHKNDRSAIVQKCLAQLSPAHREIIDLVYYHRNSVTEVARIVGVPAGTVKTRMFYARMRMAELLQAAGIDGV